MNTRSPIQTKFALLLFSIVMAVAATAGMPGEAAGDAKSFAFPEGRLGDVAAAFIHAFNSEGDKLISEFHSTYLSKAALTEHPLDQQLWRYGHMSGMLGTLTPQQVVDKKKSSLVLLIKSEDLGAFFHLGMEFDAGEPKMLDDFFIRPAPRPK